MRADRVDTATVFVVWCGVACCGLVCCTDVKKQNRLPREGSMPRGATGGIPPFLLRFLVVIFGAIFGVILIRLPLTVESLD